MNKLYWNFEVGGQHGSDWLMLNVELMKYEKFARDNWTNTHGWVPYYPQTDLLARFIEPYLELVTNVTYVSAPEVKTLWVKQCPLRGADEGFMPTEATLVAPAKLFKELHDRLLEFDEYPQYSICK